LSEKPFAKVEMAELKKESVSKRQLRPKKKQIDYCEEDEEEDPDCNIFCDECEEEFIDGCPFHQVTLCLHMEGVLKVDKSTIEGGGKGVFSILEKDIIPVGTMFGPFRGKFIKKSKLKIDSGYAWELKDSTKSKVIGVVDPGPKPDPKKHRLAYINSACYLWQQNIVAVQYRGYIWYRVVQPIAPGDELLTHYGEAYTKALGIHENFRLTKEEVATLNAHMAKEAAEAKSKVTKKSKTRGGNDVVNGQGGSGVNVSQGASSSGSRPSPAINLEAVPTGPEICATQSFVLPAAKQVVPPSGGVSTATPARAIKMGEVSAKDETLAFFICSTCQDVFGHPKGLENHIKWNSNKEGVMRCGKERAKPDPNKPKAFQCSLCVKSFTRKGNLVVHVKAIHQKIRHACHLCDKSFSQKSHLMQHQRTVHTNVNCRACLTCGKTFTDKGTLNKHIKTVHQKLKTYKCNECQKEFGEAGNLKTHINQVHKKLKLYKCNECGKEFGRAEHLKTHVDTVHRGLKPFECKVCNKKFGQKKDMERHVKRSVCEKEFEQATNLKRHIKQVHKKLKPYQCNECDKEFGRADHLKNHINTVHRGLKPFECQFCDKKFAKKSDMKRHFKRVHQDKA